MAGQAWVIHGDGSYVQVKVLAVLAVSGNGCSPAALPYFQEVVQHLLLQEGQDPLR